MKKIGLLFLCLIFLLTACSEDITQYEAKPSDFDDVGFENKYSQRIVVIGEELMIVSNNDHPDKKTSIDKLFESEKDTADELLIKKYKDLRIVTKKDRYYMTAEDGLSLDFQKIGERIVVDEEGVEYFTSKYPEEE